MYTTKMLLPNYNRSIEIFPEANLVIIQGGGEGDSIMFHYLLPEDSYNQLKIFLVYLK